MHVDAMALRMKFFVADMISAVDFFKEVLGLGLARWDPGYASVRCGSVVVGLGLISNLPEEGGYFTRPRAERDIGLGVEILLEVGDIAVDYTHVAVTSHPTIESPQGPPWSPTNFRVVDLVEAPPRVHSSGSARRALR